MTTPTELTVVLDSDFLSSFLKINSLEVVQRFFQVEDLWIPPAVFREVAETRLVSCLAAETTLKVASSPQGGVFGDDAEGLGAGEIQAVNLAKASSPSVLLMNDRKASRWATGQGVAVVNVPAFLLGCRETSFLEDAEILRLVRDLRERDHYGFPASFLDRLGLE